MAWLARGGLARGRLARGGLSPLGFRVFNFLGRKCAVGTQFMWARLNAAYWGQALFLHMPCKAQGALTDHSPEGPPSVLPSLGVSHCRVCSGCRPPCLGWVRPRRPGWEFRVWGLGFRVRQRRWRPKSKAPFCTEFSFLFLGDALSPNDLEVSRALQINPKLAGTLQIKSLNLLDLSRTFQNAPEGARPTQQNRSRSIPHDLETLQRKPPRQSRANPHDLERARGSAPYAAKPI